MTSELFNAELAKGEASLTRYLRAFEIGSMPRNVPLGGPIH
jgi:hypothetical protein